MVPTKGLPLRYIGIATRAALAIPIFVLPQTSQASSRGWTLSQNAAPVCAVLAPILNRAENLPPERMRGQSFRRSSLQFKPTDAIKPLSEWKPATPATQLLSDAEEAYRKELGVPRDLQSSGLEWASVTALRVSNLDDQLKPDDRKGTTVYQIRAGGFVLPAYLFSIGNVVNFLPFPSDPVSLLVLYGKELLSINLYRDIVVERVRWGTSSNETPILLTDQLCVFLSH